MRNYLIKTLMVIICTAVTVVPVPVRAQSSGTTLYISVSPTTVLAGEWAGISGVVINNSTAKLRTTATFYAVDPCGTKTDLGYNRLSLDPGQSVLITTSYPTKKTSCRGTHIVTISTAGKGGDPGVNASANLEVQ